MSLQENNLDLLSSSDLESDSSQDLSTLNHGDRDVFQTSLIGGSNSLVEIEAEEYHKILNTDKHQWSIVEEDSSSGQALQATPDIGANINNNYVGNSPQLDYIINFKEAGNYYAWVLGRAAGKPQPQSDSVHLGLNGQKVESAERISKFSTDYSWSNTTMDNTDAMIEILTPGIHTLNLWMREDGFIVDKVVLTTEANFDPSQLAQKPEIFKQSQDGSGLVNIEAEKYHKHIARGDRQWEIVSENNASNNEAMLSTPDQDININTDFVNKSPQLDYTIDFKEAGNYYAWVLGRAAGKSIGKSDSLHLGLNGQQVESADRISNFSTDYSWSNMTMDDTKATIEIDNPGIHTLNLWMREDGFMVDRVILTTEANFDPSNQTLPSEPTFPSEPDVPEHSNKPFIPRQEPTANIGYDNPPLSSEAWKQSWGAGLGLAPQLLFWEEVPKYQEFEGQINRVADGFKAEAVVPYAGLQLWQDVFKKSQSGEKYSELPGHQAWVEWLEARPEYLGIDRNGDTFDWGYVSPLTSLNKEDYPLNFDGDVAYYADWQADRIGRLAAFTGVNGVFFSDFFDSHPHTSPQNYFNPLIIKDFEKAANINLSSDEITEQAEEIRSQHYKEWLDYWVDRWAYNWSAIDREIRNHTGEEPLLITQTSFPPASQRRHGAVDPRVIFQHMSPDNIVFEVQTINNFMMRRLPVPESYESASIGLYAAREPEGYYGHMLMSSEGRYWDAVEELWPNLNQETQQELGWKRLKRTWLESGWTHVATRQGGTRRAAESWTRSFHDLGKINESWIELLRDIDPTRPFGPAIYYSTSIEEAYEISRGANSNPITSSYLGEFLQPVTDIKNNGVPFNYYVSDAALDKLTNENSPTAWIIPDRYLDNKDLLPTEERKLLEKVAPIVSEEEAQNYDYPLSFSSNQEGRTIDGFGFYDQNDRLIVVASDRITIGESDSNLGEVQATIQLNLDDGNYVARSVLDGQKIEFKVNSGFGEFTTTIDRWDTQAFEIIPG